MADLTGWLVGIREKSTDIGEIAFRQTERKRDEWRRISENDPVLSNASFNSALERVFDEQDDCTSTSVWVYANRKSIPFTIKPSSSNFNHCMKQCIYTTV
jgi:hypothetical protein